MEIYNFRFCPGFNLKFVSKPKYSRKLPVVSPVYGLKQEFYCKT